MAREMMEALGFSAATETKDDGEPVWGLKQLTKKVNGLHKMMDSVKEPGDKSMTRLFKDVCDELLEGSEITIDGSSPEEDEEVTETKPKKGKKAPKEETSGEEPKAKKAKKTDPDKPKKERTEG